MSCIDQKLTKVTFVLKKIVFALCALLKKSKMVFDNG